MADLCSIMHPLSKSMLLILTLLFNKCRNENSPNVRREIRHSWMVSWSASKARSPEWGCVRGAPTWTAMPHLSATCCSEVVQSSDILSVQSKGMAHKSLGSLLPCSDSPLSVGHYTVHFVPMATQTLIIHTLFLSPAARQIVLDL